MRPLISARYEIACTEGFKKKEMIVRSFGAKGLIVFGALGMWHHFVRKRARLDPLGKFSLCPPWHQHVSKAD